MFNDNLRSSKLYFYLIPSDAKCDWGGVLLFVPHKQINMHRLFNPFINHLNCIKTSFGRFFLKFGSSNSPSIFEINKGIQLNNFRSNNNNNNNKINIVRYFYYAIFDLLAFVPLVALVHAHLISDQLPTSDTYKKTK